MKSNKLSLLFILLLLPVLLMGCSKFFPTPYGNTTKGNETSDPGNITDTPTDTPVPTVTEIPSVSNDIPSAETSASGIPSDNNGSGQGGSSNPDSSSGENGNSNSDSSVDSYKTRAAELLAHMTLKEKVGQMFFVRLRKDSAANDLKDYCLGGYILFGDDFKNESKDSIKNLLSDYQDFSSIPLLIGVDEEGGIVNRVSKYSAFRPEPFKSPHDLYKEGGFEAIQKDTKEKAELLLELGINVNLAPISDVSTDATDFIYPRAFGKDAKATANYVKTVILAMNRAHIGSTLKHFPGYGNNVDTHTGIATDNRAYDQFLENDFLPFQAGIETGADSILVSHNIVTSMDKNYPASLSLAVHEIIRDTFKFDGVVMTDDLSMDAIKKYTSDTEAAVLAIEAGNDLLIATDFDTQIPAVLKAVKNGKIQEAVLDDSVTRILIWKLKLGILH